MAAQVGARLRLPPPLSHAPRLSALSFWFEVARPRGATLSTRGLSQNLSLSLSLSLSLGRKFIVWRNPENDVPGLRATREVEDILDPPHVYPYIPLPGHKGEPESQVPQTLNPKP